MNDAIGVFALAGLEPELSPLLYALKFQVLSLFWARTVRDRNF